MSVPPSPRRRKVRLVRDEVPDDTMLVVRATPADREEAVRSIAEDAGLSGEVYVIELLGGSREVLYSVSVFARRPGVTTSEVLGRFPHAPCYLETSAGRLRAAGFPVYPTGANADHYDVQLVSGTRENDRPPTLNDLLQAARRLVASAGDLLSRPSYAGSGSEE